MSGFDNEVLVCSGGRLETSSSQSISIMQSSPTAVSLINRSGTPEGAVSANPSSIIHDISTGKVYCKQTGTGNTGWVPLNGIIPYTTSIDFTASGATPLFTTANRPFVIIGFAYYGTNVNTPGGDGLANYGWTAPDYDDETNGLSLGLISSTSEILIDIPPGFSPAFVVPPLTTFYINITTPDSGVSFDVDLSVLGFYV